MSRHPTLAVALLFTLASAGRAWAQPPDEPDRADPAEEEVTDPMAKAILSGDKPDPLAEALAPQPGGLRPSEVAKRAAGTSRQVAARRAEVRVAASKLDQALAAYFPRVTLGASYTRLSEVENDLGDIPLPPGVDVSFPVIVNSYQLTATLEVPLSDYLLRLTKGYAAVSLDVEAKELALRAERLQAEAEAKIAFFTWIRAKGRAAVAELAVVQSERHLADAKATFQAGLIAEADVLRLEAQVAQSRHLGNAAQAFVAVTEDQLRTVMHLKPGAKLSIGIDVLAEPPPPDPRRLAVFQRMAMKNRLDRRSLAKAKQSLEEATWAVRAGYYPRVVAFAEGMYANPNPRIFPQENKWDFTWAVGGRLTWTINDTFTTIGAAAEVEAQAENVGARMRALEDAIHTTVTQAYYDVETARSAIAAAATRERAAQAALDARRLLFLGGKATATEMVDAEAELTEARLQRVDAHVDWLIAWARLELAVGKPLRR